MRVELHISSTSTSSIKLDKMSRCPRKTYIPITA
nr:MAG TPA: hypothetical protein [Bacteriophage sp.]